MIFHKEFFTDMEDAKTKVSSWLKAPESSPGLRAQLIEEASVAEVKGQFRQDILLLLEWAASRCNQNAGPLLYSKRDGAVHIRGIDPNSALLHTKRDRPESNGSALRIVVPPTPGPGHVFPWENTRPTPAPPRKILQFPGF